MTIISNFTDDQGDLGSRFVPKSYLMDVYEYLPDSFKVAGLWGWGSNYSGELGTGARGYVTSPVQTIAGGANWKQIDCGNGHTAAIKTDGTLWLWGDNYYGGLGDNTINAKSSPIQTVSGGTNWKQVSCGNGFTTALKTDGTLWSWGRNEIGQLGDNTAISKSSPVQTIAGGTDWNQVSAGSYHMAAIKTNGTLWLWGYSWFGELGNNEGGSTVQKSSPVQTVAGGTDWKQVSCGNSATAAIKINGTLWMWGGNAGGQLGDNTTVDKSSPVQTVAGGTDWKQVSCGGGHTAAIKTDGTLWSWGANYYGGLGDNTIDPKSSPIQTLAGGTNWKQVVCGGYHTAAIKTDGTLWLWGYNDDGELGTNDINYRSSPIQTIAGGTNWKQLACGDWHTSSIRDDSSDLI